MMQTIKKLFDVLKSKALLILLGIMSASNLLMASIIFYLLAPHIEIHKNDVEANNIAEKVIETTSADGAFYWAISFEHNTRTPLAVKTRLLTDLAPAIKYTNLVSRMSLTASVDDYTLQELISGNSDCDAISNNDAAVDIEAVRQFLKSNPQAFACTVPDRNVFGSLIGYVTVVWKNRPSTTVKDSALTQTKNIIHTKSSFYK